MDNNATYHSSPFQLSSSSEKCLSMITPNKGLHLLCSSAGEENRSIGVRGGAGLKSAAFSAGLCTHLDWGQTLDMIGIPIGFNSHVHMQSTDRASPTELFLQSLMTLNPASCSFMQESGRWTASWWLRASITSELHSYSPFQQYFSGFGSSSRA